MKNKILLGLYTWAVLFVGLSLVNIFSSMIYGLADGTILYRIAQLPYLLYAAIALVLSAVLTMAITGKS